jgi:hypothetical protein
MKTTSGVFADRGSDPLRVNWCDEPVLPTAVLG